MADSSPQGGRDWLIVKVSQVRTAGLVDVMEAVIELAQDTALQAWHDGEDEPDLPDNQIQRAELFGKILSNVTTQTAPPVALGQGRSALSDKAAAMLYAIFLETGWEQMPRMLSSFVSITSDMGTERGLSDYASVDFASLMPRYVVANKFDDDDDKSNDAAKPPWLFESSMPINGKLHILANTSKDLHKALPSFSTFYNELKHFERLLCSPMRTQRYIATCLRDSEMSDKARLFQQRVNGMYDKRWMEVHTFAAKLEERMAVLVSTWNEQKYSADHVDEAR